MAPPRACATLPQTKLGLAPTHGKALMPWGVAPTHHTTPHGWVGSSKVLQINVHLLVLLCQGQDQNTDASVSLSLHLPAQLSNPFLGIFLIQFSGLFSPPVWLPSSSGPGSLLCSFHFLCDGLICVSHPCGGRCVSLAHATLPQQPTTLANVLVHKATMHHVSQH